MEHKHDLAEMEAACADGFCPICLLAEKIKIRVYLNKYGTHLPACRIWSHEDCSCGFEQAWKGEKS